MSLGSLAVLACVCTMICVLVAGVSSAEAALELGEEGDHLGQFKNLGGGVAVDNNALSSSFGDLYVADEGNVRVDKVTGLGGPLLDWGWNVNEESPAQELQTCAAFCQPGESVAGTGAFQKLLGVAVDRQSGDVYAVDGENHRVEKFDSDGKFILMFGGEVNKTTKANVCTEEEIKSPSHAVCGVGVEGKGAGQFAWNEVGSYIAAGPKGNVYVGDEARIQIFEPTSSGGKDSIVFKEEIPLGEPNFGKENWVRSLAVNNTCEENGLTGVNCDKTYPANGDVFVAVETVTGVHELRLNKTTNEYEDISEIDKNSEGENIRGLAVDGSGDLYVSDLFKCCKSYQFLKYESAGKEPITEPGKELASFGRETVSFSQGIAFANPTVANPMGELYVTGSSVRASAPRLMAFTPPPPGPLIQPYDASGTPNAAGAAAFEATIDPEGNATTYKVEYITEAQFQADDETYGNGAKEFAGSSSISADFEDHSVMVALPEATLEPGTIYHWRFVASNKCEVSKPATICTTAGADNVLEETPAAVIEGPWASEVTSTNAKLSAQINPLGVGTIYRLEYGATGAYGKTFSGKVEGTGFVAVGPYLVQGLEPSTTYHYRLVTENFCYLKPPHSTEPCAQQGQDHTFTTQTGASESTLPDGRASELVTPAITAGPSIAFDKRQAASDGGAIVYSTHGAPLGENVVSGVDYGPNQALSRRGVEGWGTQNIHWPIHSPSVEENYFNGVISNGGYFLFSSNLASAVLSPQLNNGVLVPEALEGTYYLRNNSACVISEPPSCYTPLFTPANTPPGTELMAKESTGGFEDNIAKKQILVLAGTPNLGHIVLGSPLKLTPEAEDYSPHEVGKHLGNLYEWTGGRVRLVNILPNSQTDKSNQALTAGESSAAGQVPRVVSNDGRRIAWTVGGRYGTASSSFRALYVRDMVEEKTVRVGGIAAYYQTMSSDGSRVFFLEHGDLYVYEKGATVDLTTDHPGESSAGVQEQVSDVSEDGAYVYFVATGVVSSGQNARGEKAVAGADNLYLLHNEGGTWQAPKFIARLSGEDEKSWAFPAGGGDPQLIGVTSRVSPDGRYLTFMSNRSLTGYDNVDASPQANGAHDEEVFLYRAPANLATEPGNLICASCDPSGARPHGVPASSGRLEEESGTIWPGRWLAASLPPWELYGTADTVYQPRYLSDGGRLFFNSQVGLVPQDTNGVEDIYQYEPGGEGDCAMTGGCVSVISSGHSASDSLFMDASESGNDVFFLSSDHLTSADIDSGFDIWDAHVCSASSPCLAPPVSPPPCSSGDSCKPAPAPQPELFGAPPSATFSGTGNLAPPAPAATKPLTRAQKLTAALSSCRKQYKRSKKRRAACERTAHKRYGRAAKGSLTANAIKRGGR
jgi:hypothetical protein